MPDVLAAIGLAQIKIYKSKLIKSRQQIFLKYNDSLKHKSWAILPTYKSKIASSSFHLYALRINDCCEHQRDKIIEKITMRGIAVNVHYQPLPMLTLFKIWDTNARDFPRHFKIMKMRYLCLYTLS